MIPPRQIDRTVKNAIKKGRALGYYDEEASKTLYEKSICIAERLSMLTGKSGIGYVPILTYSIWKGSQATSVPLNPYQANMACQEDDTAWLKLVEEFDKCLETGLELV